MYQFSRKDIEMNNGKSIQHYNIVFVLVSLTVIAPVIIQYSARINVLYHKGVFQQEKLEKLSRKDRFLLYTELTFGGILKIIGIQIILKLQSFVKVVLLPFRMCSRRGEPLDEKVGKRMQAWTERTLMMNEYEVENF